LISCNQKPEIRKDKTYAMFSKTNDRFLTKISTESIIDLDTIETQNPVIKLKIKNIGKNNLNFKLRFHCECITPPKYRYALKPNEEQKINMEFPIDKTGNFSYPIWVYGNFYPYTREIRVEGYRK
jgi:hypothetical protein